MDLADRPRLARRLAALHRAVGLGYAEAVAGSASMPVAGGVAGFFGPGWPLNRVGGLPPDAVLDDAALTEIRGFYAGHGVPAEIEADPMILSVPGTLARLAGHGFRPVWQRTALVRRLDAEPPRGRPDAPPVRRETDPDTFAALVARGFSEGLPQPTSGFAHQVQAIGQRMAGAVGLVAEVDGRPAAGGAMRIVDGIASLYGQSTLPEARRRGAQTAIVAESLRLAAEVGATFAAVDANPGSVSERTLLKVGFQVAWTVTGFRAA